MRLLFHRITIEKPLSQLGTSQFDDDLLKVIISTSTNLYLYKGQSSPIGTFVTNNPNHGYKILIALSNQHQSAECLYMWISALFDHSNWSESTEATESFRQGLDFKTLA